MGQKQSMEQGYFITALQALMKEKGIKVSQSALREFFDIVCDYCPWFPDGGTVDLKDWQRVGQELKKSNEDSWSCSFRDFVVYLDPY